MNIAEGIAWLTSQKIAQDGIAVMYSRGETDLAITAIRGRTTWESDETDGSTIRTEAPDYIIEASAIATLDPAMPEPGDQITDGGRIFEVMSPGGEHPWQWADWPNKTVYRIHTKQVDTE